MKTIAIATLLLALVLAASGQQSRSTTRIKSVSAATVARLGPGKTYEIDLTRKGTVYRFNAEGTDFSRVTIRTAAGVKTFAELLKMSNTRLKGRIVVGTPADMRNHLPRSRGGTTHFDCGVFCKCDGTLDCIDLIVSRRCGGEIWCSDVTDSCFCVAKP